MSRLSESSRGTLVKASELALASSERIRLSLELLGGRCGVEVRDLLQATGAGARVSQAVRRSAPPAAGA